MNKSRLILMDVTGRVQSFGRSLYRGVRAILPIGHGSPGFIGWPLAIALTLLVPFLCQRVTFLVLSKEETKNTGGWRRSLSEGNECQWITDSGYQPTKVGAIVRGVLEDRRIFYEPPQIDEFPSVLRINNIVSRDGCLIWFWRRASVQFGLWREIPLTYVCGVIGEIKSVGKYSVTNFARGILNRMESWGRSNISPQGSQTPFVETGLRVLVKVLIKTDREYCRSLIKNQRLLRHSSLSIRYLNQDDSKDSYHQGGERSDRRIFLNDKTTNAISVDSGEYRDAGNIFLIGGAICLLLAAYTLLKRF